MRGWHRFECTPSGAAYRRGTARGRHNHAIGHALDHARLGSRGTVGTGGFGGRHQPAVLYVANEGYLDDVEINKVLDFEAALLSFANSEGSSLMAKINEKGDWNNDLENELKQLVVKFKSTQTW